MGGGAPAASPLRPFVGDIEVPTERGVRHEKGPPGLQAAEDRQRDFFSAASYSADSADGVTSVSVYEAQIGTEAADGAVCQ